MDGSVCAALMRQLETTVFIERTRPHEISAYHLIKSMETRLCCEVSCFHRDFDYGLILGYDALFIDKQLPEVSEKRAALDP